MIYRRFKLALALSSPDAKRQRAIVALKLIMRLKRKEVCIQSAELFCTVMADVVSDSWLWEPAELLLTSAFKWDMIRPAIKDPTPFVEFLRRCLLEQANGLPRDRKSVV